MFVFYGLNNLGKQISTNRKIKNIENIRNPIIVALDGCVTILKIIYDLISISWSIKSHPREHYQNEH